MTDILLDSRSVRSNNIYCIGRNYVDHIAELQNETPTEPLVFLKPNSALLRSGAQIRLPAYSADVHYEAELVLLIGSNADNLNENDALTLIEGYAVGLDLTARDIQAEAKSKGLPWTKAKGFKGAACVSDFLPAGRLPDPLHTRFSFRQNGILRQQGDTTLMIYSLPEILCHLAQTYGLRRGDLVFTGTPAGVGRLNGGDRLELELAGLIQAAFTVAPAATEQTK
ncbi:fumarylacetoacetate hydrolase family protein [Neisseria sp. 23W00296]|uniref:fumarylacetoacetate hydrolase family protein n=1 Tax=unclassified Neisseria TaxID=2623750 RepID=UPI00375770EE